VPILILARERERERESESESEGERWRWGVCGGAGDVARGAWRRRRRSIPQRF
jgi:hypothetical protein